MNQDKKNEKKHLANCLRQYRECLFGFVQQNFDESWEQADTQFEEAFPF